MNEKEKRASWLAKLNNLKAQFDTGRGVIFGKSFTGEHDRLVEAVENVAVILEGYYDRDNLSREQALQLKACLESLGNEAGAYIQRKRNNDGYALEADGDIKRAKGDKRTRLEAATQLLAEAQDMILETDHLIEGAPVAEQPEENNLIQEQDDHAHDGRRAVDLNELKVQEKESGRLKDIQAGVISSKLSIDAAKVNYKQEIGATDYKAGTYQDLVEGIELHRGDVMGFNTDAGFKASYDKHRMKIFKAVETYRALEKLEAENRDRYLQALHSMNMTEQNFLDMSDKINVLEAQGEYLDLRAKIVSNPEYIRMNAKQQKDFKNLNVQEIQEKIDMIPILNPGEQNDRKALFEDLKKLKEMGDYGIMENSQSTMGRYDTYKDTVEGKHLKTGIYFNTAYGDVGGKKKSFKDYFSSKSFNFKASENKVMMTNGEFHNADLMNVSTGLLKGKYRLFKASGKLQSEGGNLQAGGHVTIGTVKTAASVGIAFSGSRLWENKIYASASANAYGVRGVGKASAGIRKDWLKADVKGEGNIGSATAIAQGGVGMIRYKDKDGKDKEGFGVAADLTAAAAVFEGSASGGITIFGVRIGGKVSAAAVAVGVKSRFVATGDVLSFGLSAALGIGAGFEISIDISGLKEKIKNWRERRATNKKLRDKKQREAGEKRLEKYSTQQGIAEDFEVINKETEPKRPQGPVKNK